MHALLKPPKKYLGLAAVKGAEEATKQAEETLRNALSEQLTSSSKTW